MIYEFEISTLSQKNRFLQEIENKFTWIKEKEFSLCVDIKTDEKNKKDFIFLVLQGKQSDNVFRAEDIIYIFKHQMSEIVAEHILNDWESTLLWKEIQRNCKNISLEEKEIIYNKSSEFIRKCNNNESLNLLINFGRKNSIAHRVLEHINNNRSLAIEGFINFCMQDYLTEIKFAVELAVDELKNEKEYNEFIKLLRYFVESQIPRVFEVNIVMDSSGMFFLWDENGIDIEQNYLDYYLNDMLLEDINLDDVLISILITIAPRRIVLHNTKSLNFSEPVKIIKNVFKEKIKICTGCERCYQYISESDRRRHP